MSRIKELAARVSRQATGSDDDIASALIEAAPEVNEFLSEDTTDCPDCPPNPRENPTDAESKAWTDAHKLKTFAGQATQHHVKAMSHQIKRRNRKNGTPISRDMAEKTAQTLIDTAKDQSLEDTAAALLESRNQA